MSADMDFGRVCQYYCRTMRNKYLWMAMVLVFWLVIPQTPQAKSEFVAAFASSQLVLDPLHSYKTQELQIATAIYEGLVTYHPVSLAPVPGVADRWELSDDGLLYRFYLRENARFSNGDRVTAQDFRDSWLRILEPASEGEYSFLFDVIEGAPEYRDGKETDPKSVGIHAVSESILEVKLNKPAGHFLSMLCHMTFAPVHRMYRTESRWDSGTTIVGNGPFSVSGRTRREIVLSRNELYWDLDNVKLESIRIRFMDNEVEITSGINDGSIHWAENGDVDTLVNRNSIQFYPLFGTSYMYFSTNSSPWSDSRVRRGLALLLPWKSIREQASAFGTETLVPTLSFYPQVKGITEPDVAQGLELLEEAGYPRGSGLPHIVIRVPRGSSAELAANSMAAAWKQTLETTVTVQADSYDNYLSSLKSTDYTIASATWIGDFPDPLTFLQIWTSGSNLNDARYANPAFDALIDHALGDTGDQRYLRLAEAEELLLSEAVVLPLSNPPAFNLVDLNKISGWYPNPLDVHPFKYLRFKQLAPPPGYVRRTEQRNRAASAHTSELAIFVTT